MNDAVLKVENLKTYFHEGERVKKAVDDVSFEVLKSRTLGLVGESGCGKTVTALSVMRLVPKPAGQIVEGRIKMEDLDLLGLSDEEMRRVRGRKISMVFQEPMTSLNPVFTIGRQLVEVFETHFNLRGHAAREEATALMAKVGLPDPKRRFSEYPHQMSGGMRQRVLIAMALAGEPKVLIADEPTTALDVTIQAQILELINKLRDEMGMGTLMITHDLGVIAETAERVAVMYAGRIVEMTTAGRLFRQPYHPYTEGLMKSLPSIKTDLKRKGNLPVIPGTVPDLALMPSGCPFEPRCYRRKDVCRKEVPPSEFKESDHMARCWVAP